MLIVTITVTMAMKMPVLNDTLGRNVFMRNIAAVVLMLRKYSSHTGELFDFNVSSL